MVVTLRRAYRSRFGAPVISRVHRQIFELRYFTHCLRCTFCHDACCWNGVDVDVENVRRIMQHVDALQAYLGRPASEWFEEQYDQDPEFPGGSFTRTRVIDGACVFLGRGERGCLLHRYAAREGIDYHELKPLVSALFPLTFADGVLCAATEVETGELVCTGSGLTLYEGVRDELRHYFGGQLVRELDMLARSSR
jgi:Fe-S-cluster containining protein